MDSGRQRMPAEDIGLNEKNRDGAQRLAIALPTPKQRKECLWKKDIVDTEEVERKARCEDDLQC